jgi:hypothetical protein
MKRLITLTGIAIAVVIFMPVARAQEFLLDSGTPASSTMPILSNNQWFGAEFQATAGDTITQLSAYLAPNLNSAGATFTFDIYEDDGGAFLNTRNVNLGPLLFNTTTATFNTTGWTSASVDWTVTTTDNYWLVIEENSTLPRNRPTFDVPEETSAGTGTAPAEAFAISSGTQFTTASAPPIGLEVTATPVPEPTTALFGIATTLAMVTTRRRRARG